MKTKELKVYSDGRYVCCLVKELANGRLSYVSHTGGARKSWREVIKQINAGDKNPSYVTSAGDCFSLTDSSI